MTPTTAKTLAALALALIVGAAACGGDGNKPEARFVVETSISDASIRSDQAATITYRLRNGTAVEHTVNVGCAFYAYFRTVSGATVYPPGGTFDCPGYAVEFWILPPGGELTRTLRIAGLSSPPSTPPAVALPAGRYLVHAEFTGTVEGEPGVGPLRSSDVPFEIRP